MLRGDARSQRKLPKKGFSKLVEDLQFTKVSIFQNEKTPHLLLVCQWTTPKWVDIFHIVGLLPIYRFATNQRTGAPSFSVRQESPPHERSLLSPPQFSPKASSPKSPLRRMSRDTDERAHSLWGVFKPPFRLGVFFFWWDSKKKYLQWILVRCFFWWRKIQISPPKVASLTSKSSPF